MDQLLNQHYMDYVQGARNRQAGGISAILRQGPGAENGQSWQSGALEGLGNYAGGNFGKDLEGILDSFNQKKYNQSDSIQDTFPPARKGFEDENPIYNPYTGIQSYGGG